MILTRLVLYDIIYPSYHTIYMFMRIDVQSSFSLEVDTGTGNIHVYTMYTRHSEKENPNSSNCLFLP